MRLQLLFWVCLSWITVAPALAIDYPDPITPSPWIQTHQRFAFGIGSDNLEEVINQGVNFICAGTNAAGMGLAGGPIGLNSQGELINVYSGELIPEETLDRMRGNVDTAHKHGAKIIGELIRFWNNPVLLVDHPEWQELASPDAKPLSLDEKKMTDWPPLTGCWNSPFGDHVIKSTVALAERLNWDGYNLDGLGCWTQCYCPACRESYRADTGKDIPVGDDLNNPEFRRYLKWRLRRYTQFIARWQLAMKEVNPEFAACPWTTGPGRWWHWSFAPFAEGTDAMHRLLDAPMLELFWDFPPDQGTNLLPSFTVRYYRGLTGDRPPIALPYYCTQGQMGMQPPQVECDFRLFTVLTNGALAAQGLWQQSDRVPYSHYLDVIKEREPWTANAKSVKWAAMLMSESSRLLYGVPGKRSELQIGQWIGSGVDSPASGDLPPGERRLPAHMESAIGVFRAMNEAHLPLDMITEQDAELGDTLSQYKVVILPNTACLSDQALANLRRFVENGGGLVAFQESSLCDEYGTRREDFGLADLYGASFKGTEDFSARWPNYPKVTELILESHPITDDDVIRDNYRRQSERLNYIGWTANAEPKEGVRRIGRRLGNPEWPLGLVSERGKGRVVYYGADLGQSYFIAPYQYLRPLITNAAKWAAGDQAPPVEVEAPLCVQMAAYHQKDGQRLVIHLLNEINTSADRALPENNSSMREEVVPIHDIKVMVRNREVNSAWLEPGHQQLNMEKTAKGVEITVPSLDLHKIVVVE